MTVMFVPIVLIVLAAAMVLVLAKTERERPHVRKEAVKPGRKEGFADLLVLVERELSGFELGTEFLEDVRRRLRGEKLGR